MIPSAALLALLALFAPAGAEAPRELSEEARAAPLPAEGKLGPLGFRAPAPEPWRALADALRPPPARQVRIEQRVIIRISPNPSRSRERMMAEFSGRAARQGYLEEPMDGCLAVEGIAGVQPSRPGRLLLFMRDRRVLSASLERSCNAADFYSGFYVERSADGALCPLRDRLQSRSGASCRISQFNRLVEGRD